MLINSRAVARKAGGSVKWDDHDDGDFDQEDVDDEPGDDHDDGDDEDEDVGIDGVANKGGASVFLLHFL